jgi:hypothetical protein
MRLLPTTRHGAWAVGLAAASVATMLTWSLLPGGGFLGLACGIAGGVVGLVAIVREGERGITVFVAIIPLLGAGIFVLAELLVGHD